MGDWTLIEVEFSDGSAAPSLLNQAAEWLAAMPQHPRGGPSYYVVGVNWSQHEWTGHGGADDVLTLYVRVAPEVSEFGRNKEQA